LIATYIKPVQLERQFSSAIRFVLPCPISMENKYVCPDLDESLDLEIKNGRHPVIENNFPECLILQRCFLDRNTAAYHDYGS
jgi:DNA mismatch repair protein MutS